MAQLEETVLPLTVFMDLDRNGPIPLYFQISQRLEQAIHDELLVPGARLENEIALAARLGLSRPTIRRAIQELVDKGMLVRRRGVGTQVVQGRVNRDVALTSLHDDLKRSGKEPSTVLLSHEVRECTEEEADRFAVPAGSECLQIRRLRMGDDVPLAILENVLTEELLDISRQDLEKYGLYQILRSKGVSLRVAKQTIGARAATEEEAKVLEIDEGAPVLTVTRVAFDNTGRTIEMGRHCYRPDLYSFEVTLVDR
ncbi:MAG TPA: GntR family transcriptional regulator [Beutenbergiaceae bacterium]|nr:GntR family transcriptional regulator [Beutenbergiaceae bacterium]